MSLLGALERRALSFQTMWGSGADLADVSNTEAGVRVTQSSALALTATYACVALLADTVSSLPVGTFRRQGGARVPEAQPEWMFQPEAGNPSSSWDSHIAEVMVSLLLDGNAFIYTGRDDNGEVIDLRVLDPALVEPKVVNGQSLFEVRGANGQSSILDSFAMRHIWRIRQPGKLRGLSPIEAARQTLGKTLAAESFGARFFGSGANLSGVILAKQKMDAQSADELKAKFAAKYGGVSRSHGVGVLDGEADWKPLSVSPEQAQFLATLDKGDEDVARLFRVPPPLAGITKPGAMAYASVEALLIAFEKFTVRPYVEAIETSYRPLLPPGVYLKLNTNGLLRGDFKSRMEGYSSGVQGGYMLRSEARSLEDLPPVAGLDEPLVPLALGVASTADQSARINALGELIRAGFDPIAAAAAVGLPPIKHNGLVPVTVQGEDVATQENGSNVAA